MLLILTSTHSLKLGTAGHHIRDCPTNFDPSFNPTPSSNYCCYRCGAWDNHFFVDCPQASTCNVSISPRRESSENHNRQPSLKKPSAVFEENHWATRLDEPDTNPRPHAFESVDLNSSFIKITEAAGDLFASRGSVADYNIICKPRNRDKALNSTSDQGHNRSPKDPHRLDGRLSP